MYDDIGGGGGLSEAVAVPWNAVLPLPDNVDLDTGGKYLSTHPPKQIKKTNE
jgi:NADPH:quinone reductase-like Zn-dependent oxidoreductase